MPESFRAVNEGFMFCRGQFALDELALARHSDAAFTGVAPTCGKREIGLLEITSPKCMVTPMSLSSGRISPR